MKKLHLLSRLLLLVALIAGGTSVWAEEVCYTLDGTQTGGNNGYATASTIIQNGISWQVMGNTTQNPWRIGGNALNNEERPIYSQTAMKFSISKVELEVGAAASITVNSLTLFVAKDPEFNSKIDEVSISNFSANSTFTFIPNEETKWPVDSYFKFVFNVTVSGTSSTNRYVEFKRATFYTLEAVSIVTPPTFSLEEGTYTEPQSVTITTNEEGGTTYYTTDGSTPDNNSDKYESPISITETTTLKAITYKGDAMSDITSATYTIKKPYIIIDGVFDFVTAGNAYPLVDYGSEVTPTNNNNYITEDRTWIAGNVTMVTSGKYRWWSDDYTLRFYNNEPASSATFSVPDGYIITKIETTGASFEKTDIGTLKSTTWTGMAQNVKLSIGTTTRSFKSITITYTNNLTKEVTNAGWATWVTPYNVKFDEGEAFIVTSVGDKVNLESITSVPANTPLLLKGEGIKIATVLNETPAMPTVNELAISDGTNGNGDYVLSNKNGNVGFYKWVGSPLEEGKVYLPASAVAGAHDFVGFDNETTEISAAPMKNETKNDVFYNLAGQRVAQPAKGLYIMNGQKVVIK